jgi:hypothetical protein
MEEPSTGGEVKALSSPSRMFSSKSEDADDSLLSMNFNQDGGCLAVGTNRGFRICNVSPFQETFRRSFANASPTTSATSLPNDDTERGSSENSQNNNNRGGGIGAIEMLFRCNLLALVGGGTNPHYPPNKVIIWDDHSGRPIGDRTFRQRVLTVKLRRDRICVAVRDKVYVYNFANFELLDTIITGGEKNGPGLLCISTDAGDGHVSFSPNGRDDNGMVLACPSIPPGQVRVELYGQRKNVLIDAHEGALAAMALTVDGSLLATASVRGTIIRLFDTGKKSTDDECMSHPPGTPLREFRRGVEQAKIRCLTFSLDNLWLGCASDRSTVHVFGVKKDKKDDKCKSSSSSSSSSNSTSKSTVQTASKLAKSFLPSMLTKSPKKYLLEGDQSYAQVRGIPHPQSCAFVPNEPNMIGVAGLDEYGNGCLLMASFGPGDRENIDSEMPSSSYLSSGINRLSDRSHRPNTARRVAFHRFFKKGMCEKTGSDDMDKEFGQGRLLFSDDNENESTQDVVFGDDDGDGFISVKTDSNEKSNESIPTVASVTSKYVNEEVDATNNTRTSVVEPVKKIADNTETKLEIDTLKKEPTAENDDSLKVEETATNETTAHTSPGDAKEIV